eukprot:8214431-Alexandrium_andersonii.AAC.1
MSDGFLYSTVAIWTGSQRAQGVGSHNMRFHNPTCDLPREGTQCFIASTWTSRGKPLNNRPTNLIIAAPAWGGRGGMESLGNVRKAPVSYTHLRAHETSAHL